MASRIQAIKMFARTTEVTILRRENSSSDVQQDVVAVEEPLEMYVTTEGNQNAESPFAITMRTPGHDKELIAGLLFSEGIVSSHDQISQIEDNLITRSSAGMGNAVKVWLKKGIEYNPDLLQRNTVTTSSCGFCGRLTMPAPPFQANRESMDTLIQPEVMYSLPQALRKGQILFKHTGGIHAAALFDRKGLLLNLAEDVGRHNAMDKLVGHALFQSQLPFSNHILCFSGRVSFELMQKAIMTGVPAVVSIGAPSSLAIKMAADYGITLIGFAKSDRYNVYTHIPSMQW